MIFIIENDLHLGLVASQIVDYTTESYGTDLRPATLSSQILQSGLLIHVDLLGPLLLSNPTFALK